MNTDDVHDWGAAPDLFGPRHEYRESLILRRFVPMLTGTSLLNAGAGAGSMTYKLVDRGFDVTSVEYSPALVERVRQELGRRQVTSSNPVAVGDLQTLDLPTAAFDGAVCAEVLEHLDDDRAAAGHLARVLRPGGALVVSVPADPFRFDWVDRWAGHRRRYTADGLRELLAGAGFVDVEVTGWGFPVTGIYHRFVYRPMLRRRLAAQQSGAATGGGGPRRVERLAAPLLRAAFEVDTAFMGRVGAHFGLIATARTPGGAVGESGH